MRPKGWQAIDDSTDVFINGKGHPLRVRSSVNTIELQLVALANVAHYIGEPISQIGDWEVKPVHDEHKMFVTKVSLARFD